MHKYIKFIKDHTSGQFRKGDVVKIHKDSYNGWVESEYAESATKKEYESFIEDKEEALRKQKSDAQKAHQEKQDVRNKKNKKKTPVAETPEEEKVYHTITQADLDANPDLADDGVEVGTEVLLNDDGDMAVDDNGDVIVKGDGEGNGEASGEEAEKFYKALTQEDLDSNADLIAGLSVGTEVEVGKEGNWVVDDDGRLIIKPEEK